MLKIENIHFSYNKKKDVLSALQLEVQAGEVMGILGMNGTGKTTLFRSIYGFLNPHVGTISLNENRVDFRNTSFLETENYFYPYMLGREYLEIVTKGNYDMKMNKIFDLPLSELIDNYSTGMKKRLAFWGIIELNKELVILDEPFNGVDIESVECFYSLIEKMKIKGNTILISSHIIESLIRTCDKIAYLSHGSIRKIYNKNEFTLLREDIKLFIDNKVRDAFLD